MLIVSSHFFKKVSGTPLVFYRAAIITKSSSKNEDFVNDPAFFS